jgi:hypothetical protein
MVTPPGVRTFRKGRRGLCFFKHPVAKLFSSGGSFFLLRFVGAPYFDIRADSHLLVRWFFAGIVFRCFLIVLDGHDRAFSFYARLETLTRVAISPIQIRFGLGLARRFIDYAFQIKTLLKSSFDWQSRGCAAGFRTE